MGISGHPKKKEKKEWLANIKQSDIDLIDKVIITQKNPIKESNVNILDSIKSFYITKNIFSYLKKKKYYKYWNIIKNIKINLNII